MLTDVPGINLERVTEPARTFDRAGGDVIERRCADVGHEVADDEFDAIRTMIEAVRSE
ncbi:MULTISPECIES: hypothetical protein [Natrialbaceae]|uniref:hypothetical protein n=1 Tax=Natrialbaceae TaxID=1644061 RepID=UPI00207C6D8D|nr:hypothetical protein [Natronococcus sp. CG52]